MCALRCSRILPAGHLATVEYSHRIWRIEDGLPQNKIQAIAQTPTVTCGRTSEGLARFDGVRFTVSTARHTRAPDDSILALTTRGTAPFGSEPKAAACCTIKRVRFEPSAPRKD